MPGMVIDPDDVIRRLWTAFPSQAVLPMRHVAFADGSEPEAHQCERDVLRWTGENPGYEPVHGWLATGLLIQKHWIVRDRTGRLINITPLEPPTPVFEHPGSVAEFMRLNEEIHLVHFQHLRRFSDG
jgi:hypothetical protein